MSVLRSVLWFLMLPVKVREVDDVSRSHTRCYLPRGPPEKLRRTAAVEFSQPTNSKHIRAGVGFPLLPPLLNKSS